MTRRQLQTCTKKTLLDLARKQGIAGWHDMTKDELVSALASGACQRPGKRNRGVDTPRSPHKSFQSSDS